MLLKKGASIGLFPAQGLGDGLTYCVLANNLVKNGYHVTVYSSILFPLQKWFPSLRFATPESEELIAKKHDHLIINDPGAKRTRLRDIKNIIFMGEKTFNEKKSVVENLVDYGMHILGLSTKTHDNGLTVPNKRLVHRRYKNRVIIHPYSANERKNWPGKKFIQLSEKLKQRNFQPVFIMSPKEREVWLNLFGLETDVPGFKSLHEVAEYIYESGFMIGNDSGVGHLASNLGIPTLSIFRKNNRMRLWRPSLGAYGEVVTVARWLQYRPFARRWKRFLSVNKVFCRFINLVHRFENR